MVPYGAFTVLESCLLTGTLLFWKVPSSMAIWTVWFKFMSGDDWASSSHSKWVWSMVLSVNALQGGVDDGLVYVSVYGSSPRVLVELHSPAL